MERADGLKKVKSELNRETRVPKVALSIEAGTRRSTRHEYLFRGRKIFMVCFVIGYCTKC